jgi:glycosyltransferase involved in cell wall biosynthesis
MTASKPRVSIGMPVYNEERYIGEALDSLLSQSVKNFELIISDNASTDRTGEICLAYAAKDSRVRYYRTETNVGSIANFNRVFQLSNADYFFFASGHDLWHESFIARCLEILEHDPSVVLCYPATRWIEPDGGLGDVITGWWGTSFIDTRRMARTTRFLTVLWGLGGYCYPSGGIMRSDALKRTDLMIKTLGPDVLMIHELALLGAFVELPEPLLYARKPSDFGSWNRYLIRTFGTGAERLSAWYVYGKMIWDHARSIAKYARSNREKVILSFLVVYCLVSRYRWVLHGLRARPRSRP